MLRLLYRLDRFMNGDSLGSSGFYPFPVWLKRYIAKYPRSKQLAIIAKLVVGTDLSQIAKNELACAESVSRLINQILPDFGVVTGTYTLNDVLLKDKRFKQVSLVDIQTGDIVVSPTGYGNGNIPNGHTGVIGENKRIFSNDSATGKWLQNYTVQSWVARYKLKGGYPINIFRIV